MREKRGIFLQVGAASEDAARFYAQGRIDEISTDIVALQLMTAISILTFKNRLHSEKNMKIICEK